MLARAIGALFDSDAGVLRVPIFLTLNASNRDAQVLVDAYQVIFNTDTSGEKLVGGLWVKTRDF